MKKILVPCDFSKQAISAYRYALDIAAQSKGSIHLLHVIELPVLHDSILMPVLNFEQAFFKELHEKATIEFKKITKKFSEEGVKVIYEVKFGVVWRMILDYAKDNSIDLVIMGSSGASGIREFLIGSNAEKMVRNSPVPVLTLKNYSKGPIKKIIFPNTLETENQEDLVLKVVALQNFFKARLHVVWVNTPYNFTSDNITHERLKKFAKRFLLKDYTLHVFNYGDDEQGILQFAQEVGGQLIAMGTHGRKGIAHVLSGSLAEDVVNHTQIPVWTYSLKEMNPSAEVMTEAACQHCGLPCEAPILFDNKSFCCYGCKTVFEILSTNDLCEYYALDKNAGVSLQGVHAETYSYLDEPDVRKRIVTFDSPSFSKLSFFIPSIHCVSCIWLLENLQKIKAGALRSEVNFARKTVTIDFNPLETKVSELAGLLSSLGYTPQIHLEKKEDAQPQADKSLFIKLAVAGFCFGNVMLFSFPEYLGIDHSEQFLLRTFSWLNFTLSIPVFFYSGLDYLRSALKSFRQKQINIDVPIAAGLLALFLRSSYDIITATGPGYLDSFTGLVFFLLIGRWFQGKTYESLAFDRDFKSYFPLAVHKQVGDEWKATMINQLHRGDQIKIRNMEIVPADAVLLDEYAYIDYSFVTGESKPVFVKQSEKVYAGGRLIGSPVRFVVEKKTSQSQLTSLWNNDAFRKVTHSGYQKSIDKAARVFTWTVMGIALITAIYWQITMPTEMWLVLTAVLMVACPCALALAAPFTYGNMLRAFGRHQLYLKNADVIERLAAIDSVVFDKTGTITYGNTPEVAFSGELSKEEWAIVKLLTSASAHPLSSLISKSIKEKPAGVITKFREIPGKGLEGRVSDRSFKIGAARFVGFDEKTNLDASHVFVSVDDEIKGHFSVQVSVRKNLEQMLIRLGNKCVALLSGDNESDKAKMNTIFHSHIQLLFHQTPQDKLGFIKNLQADKRKVLMVGDGLNDAGALKQSDVGLAVTDDTGVFTPACDGILHGARMNDLDKFLGLAKSSTTILKTAFVISFLYNAIALSFAVTGNLTPLVAAILMPISSISVVGFSTLAVNYMAHQKLKT